MGQVCVEDVTYSSSRDMSLSRLLNSRMLQLRHDLATSASPTSVFSQDRRPLPIRRNLFGPLNHQQCLKFAQDEMEKMAQADSRRWNFDFNNMKPTEGFFSWQRVQDNDAVIAEGSDVPDITCNTSNATTCLTTSTSTNRASQTCTPSPQPTTTKSIKRLQKLPPQRLTKKLCSDYFSEKKSATSRQVDRSKLVLNGELIGNSASYVNAKLSEIVKMRSTK